MRETIMNISRKAFWAPIPTVYQVGLGPELGFMTLE